MQTVPIWKTLLYMPEEPTYLLKQSTNQGFLQWFSARSTYFFVFLLLYLHFHSVYFILQS